MIFQTLNRIDFDHTLDDTTALSKLVHQLLMQQLVNENPELRKGKIFVDSRDILDLDDIRPAAADIELYGSFKVALQKKYRLEADWAEKRLKLLYPQLCRLMEENAVSTAQLDQLLLEHEEAGCLNIIHTQNDGTVVQAWLNVNGLAARFGKHVYDRKLADKTTALGVTRLRKELAREYGNFKKEKSYDDLEKNFIWPYFFGVECVLIGSKPASAESLHHQHHATIIEALQFNRAA